MKEFYIYFLIDPRVNEVFYIGKGKTNRINSHFKDLEKFREMIKNEIPYGNKFKNTNKLYRMMEIEDNGYEVRAFKIVENIEEKAAFALEEYLIERFGREFTKTGKLLNLEPGGNWKYPKIWLEDNEKITIDEIETSFPELLDVIDNIELIYRI